MLQLRPLALAALWLPAAAQAATYTVNRATDEALGMGGVTCAAGDPCTLRAAIARANINPGADTIQFGFGGAPTIISPTSLLPEIIGPLTIDGYANGAGTPNTAATGHNAVITIRIDGASQPGGPLADGLRFGQGSSHSRLTGVAVTRFTGRGVAVNGYGQAAAAERIAIVGNFIGTDGSGMGDDATGALANTWEGIDIRNSARLTRVGGPLPAERNLIVGKLAGVNSNRDQATLVANNYIGTDRTGNVPRGATFQGVRIDTAGTTVQGNVIGAVETGVFVGGEADGVSVARNRIGVGTGGAPIAGPASQHGVWLTDLAPLNVGHSPGRIGIGGTLASDGNTIAHWGGSGIFVQRNNADSPEFVRLWWLNNRIYATGQLPIELIDTVDNQGLNPGDPAPPKINAGQPAPAITAATGDGSGTQVTYSLQAVANASYAVQAFATPACHASGYGPGQLLLGTHTIDTTNPGTFSFTASGLLPAASGSAITLTATRVFNDTTRQSSEFSQCFPLAGGAAGTPPMVNVPGLTATVGQPFSANLAQYVDATDNDAIQSYALTGAAPGLSATGAVLAGMPTAPGTYHFTLAATDKDGTASAVFTLTVTGLGGPGDPGNPDGPGGGNAVAVPTLGHAGLLLLSGLVGALGWRRKRYRN
ncbi:Ig domain-containing protein [Paenacidovorax monticola]|uniref:IPTL-CTERM sorting domain-containing protein n=1 Tax=Paenacidovorax monticola TaxID=1926868 RepID=A0A7H0HKF1_9BURK|nr:Ig domain-containing protein [Paenacidovorax monticola]QNP61017.1 IPTL-CTERM sorting domain-containing protein [Paenacidovorax monticola]